MIDSAWLREQGVSTQYIDQGPTPSFYLRRDTSPNLKEPKRKRGTGLVRGTVGTEWKASLAQALGLEDPRLS